VVETQKEFDAWVAKQKSQYELAHASATPAPAPQQEPAKDTTQKAVAAIVH